MTRRRRWQGPDPVVGPSDPPHRDDVSPLGPVLDRLLAGFGAPPVDALAAIFDRWSDLAGAEMADHVRPASISGTTLSVSVDDPLWATEVRYRQGEVLRRCDEAFGPGVIDRIEVRVDGPGGPRRMPSR